MSMTNPTLINSLSYFLTSSAVARPAAWQVRLHTAAPGDTGASEVTDSGYSAQASTFAVNTSSKVAANSTEMNFGTATTGYTVTHISVWDTTNNVALLTQRLSADKVVAAGAQAIMAAGELTIGGTL